MRDRRLRRRIDCPGRPPATYSLSSIAPGMWFRAQLHGRERRPAIRREVVGFELVSGHPAAGASRDEDPAIHDRGDRSSSVHERRGGDLHPGIGGRIVEEHAVAAAASDVHARVERHRPGVIGRHREIRSERPRVRRDVVDLVRVRSAAETADGIDPAVELGPQRALAAARSRAQEAPGPRGTLGVGGGGSYMKSQEREGRERVGTGSSAGQLPLEG